MSGFEENFNIQNWGNSTGNSVRYTYEMSGFEEKLNVQRCGNSMGNCVHDTYGTSRFVEKLNVQTIEIQLEILYIICTECLNL